jgi:hypothetical protein
VGGGGGRVAVVVITDGLVTLNGKAFVTAQREETQNDHLLHKPKSCTI